MEWRQLITLIRTGARISLTFVLAQACWYRSGPTRHTLKAVSRLPAQRVGGGPVADPAGGSIRPNPYSTSCGAAGITGAEAAGSRRTGPARPAPPAGSRTPEGITGVTGRALDR